MLAIAFAISITAAAADKAPAVEDYLGTWDIGIKDPESTFNSSWWKIEKKGDALQGSVVWKWGSVVPAKKVSVEGGELVLVKAEGNGELVCRVRSDGKMLKGTVRNPDGKSLPIEGRRAPELRGQAAAGWAEPVLLFDGKTLQGWKSRRGNAAGKGGWKVEDGALVCDPGPDNDLYSEKKFQDFKLHLQYKVEKGSNSGIYLRGRYEVQILDDHGKGVTQHGSGAVYSRLSPKENASLAAGEWQTCDITLVGRTLTVVLNGKTVIENGHLEGITGGALTPDEGEPGPIMLQGDHGKVSFRDIRLTPAK